MIEITLACGAKTLVSDQDLDLIDFNWCDCGGYAARRLGGIIYLHHVVVERMGLKILEGMEVDHIDRNKFNNQRDNLRVVTKGINTINVERSNNTSGCRGVSYDRNRNKWEAIIVVRGSKVFLGRFSTYEEAVKARKAAEDRYLRSLL